MRTPTVLIVEDDESIRELTRIALHDIAGWNVLLAANGMTGIELAQQHLPDAILLDLSMPDLSGFEVLSRLRAADSTGTIPVIAFTASVTSSGTTSPWEGYDFHGVIQKPYSLVALGDQIKEMIGWNPS